MKQKRSSPASSDRSIRIQAYEHIRRMILQGELGTEDVVSELAIAEKLGSSRTPVREAIGQLVAEGLLEQTPNRGTAVVQFKRQDIIELYELREALECYAAGKAARSRTQPSEFDQWQTLTDRMVTLKNELEQSGKPSLDYEQMQRFMSYDFGFHTMLMHLGANARILKIVNDSRVLIRIFTMGRHSYDLQQLGEIHRQHSLIIQAVADRNPEVAAKLISEHIHASQQERLTAFEAWEREASLRKNMPTFFQSLEG